MPYIKATATWAAAGLYNKLDRSLVEWEFHAYHPHPTCKLHLSGQTSTPSLPHAPCCLRPLHLFPLPWTARDSKRASKTQFDSRQRSDFSLCMSLGFGHKSRWIHIFQLGPGFCPEEWRDSGVGPAPDQPLLERTVRGEPNVWPRRPFDWCTPAMSRARPHAQTLTRIRTLSLPWTFSRNAPYNTHSPLQTKSPTDRSFREVMVLPSKMAAPGPEGCNAWSRKPPSCGQWIDFTLQT